MTRPVTNVMRLVSWNVNGLRALHRQGHWRWLENSKPDIFCLQEIKVEEQELAPEVQNPRGYKAFFNSSKERKGYSGVATYTKIEPTETRYDVLGKKFNTEGRLVESRFGFFTLINTYIPNGGRGKERLGFKLEYYDSLLERMEQLRYSGESIVMCGDLNVAHEEIDLARPRENSNTSGFLPEERSWFDELINLGYIDTFRYFHPNRSNEFTYWDQVTRARDRNVGWRIDYFLVSSDLEPRLKRASIKSEIFGSDHCPIELELDI